MNSFLSPSPAGNAIQAFGYGLDSMQNKSASVPAPSATAKTGADWSRITSDPPFDTIPQVGGSHLCVCCRFNAASVQKFGCGSLK